MKRFLIELSIILILVGGLIFLGHRLNYTSNQLKTSVANEKAFIIENNSLKEQAIEFQFTIDQLNYYNDSILNKMNEVRKELKIKDKDLKALQYQLSLASKIDTIFIKDSIFVDKDFRLDTLIGNEWYNIKLGLQYPNIVITEPTFKSEQYVVFSNHKETINPPKKCFIGRLFQKKHTVVEVNVMEESPYIKVKQQKYITIIK